MSREIAEENDNITQKECLDEKRRQLRCLVKLFLLMMMLTVCRGANGTPTGNADWLKCDTVVHISSYLPTYYRIVYELNEVGYVQLQTVSYRYVTCKNQSQ